MSAHAQSSTRRETDSKLDYDRPIEGLRALDRYTLQIDSTSPTIPTCEDLLAFVGAVAREVVEAAGGDIRARAVGTGPYRLREWRRGSRIVLEANPRYRQLRFPESDDPAYASLERSMRGKALPQIGVVEINIIEEDLTRLLDSSGEGSITSSLRGEVANRLLADGKLKPEYAARGITRHVFTEPYVFSLYFNIEDPLLGGMGNDRIALRRAIALAMDTATLVKVVYAGQALPANQLVPPGVAGHDPSLPSAPLYDPAAAKALLDRFGYGSCDAEGYRMAPDGQPLTVTVTLRSGAISREIETLSKKCMDAVGLRMDFHVTPFQDAVKELERGRIPDVLRRLRRLAVGMAGVAAALQQANVADQLQPVQFRCLRPRCGRVSARRNREPSRLSRHARCPNSRGPTCPSCR